MNSGRPSYCVKCRNYPCDCERLKNNRAKIAEFMEKVANFRMTVSRCPLCGREGEHSPTCLARPDCPTCRRLPPNHLDWCPLKNATIVADASKDAARYQHTDHVPACTEQTHKVLPTITNLKRCPECGDLL